MNSNNMRHYQVTTNNIHVTDSYAVPKKRMNRELVYVKVMYGHKTVVFDHRSYFSLKCEWICHNFLYRLGISRDRTKDLDLNYPLKHEWLYKVLGVLAWVFVK